MLRRLNKIIWRRAKEIVVLDRFMLARVQKHMDISGKTVIMPPWPHEDELASVPRESNPFRRKHGLEGKFVVMYSGNHGHSTPIATILDAAERLRHRDDIVFMFIGGGVRKKEVEERLAAPGGAPNVRALPYQPLDQIKYSLSAADVHLVSVGNEVVGIVHPCKVYGAMAVARPILLLGPDPCHISDLVRDNDIGWQIVHGDVDGAVRTIEAIAATPRATLEEKGHRAANVIHTTLSKGKLCSAFCDVVARGMPAAASESTKPVAQEATS
jgi:glycosyltransferase involved in cell wall biosynthesis